MEGRKLTKRSKGIKRHETLKPLSRHHMIALHIALKLSRSEEENKKELKQELLNFWEPDGQQHFREEEEILLPVFAQHTSIDRPEIIEMLLEHVQIRSLIDTVLTSEEVDIATLKLLSSTLETHVRKEERIIFPMIEKALPEQVLIEMAPYLH